MYGYDFDCEHCILLTKKDYSIQTYKPFCFADGRLMSCFGKSKLEVTSFYKVAELTSSFDFPKQDTKRPSAKQNGL